MQRWRRIPWWERQWTIYAIIRRLEPNASLGTIQERVLLEHGKALSNGYLYATLERLERNGYLRVESRLAPTVKEHMMRGGRPVLYYFATGKRRPAPRLGRAFPGWPVGQPQRA